MRPNVLVNISLAFSIISLLVFITIIALCLNRGFDLTDESYYLLATKYPFDNRLLNSAFGLINHRLAFGFNDLFALRLFKLIYQLFFLAIFARAFFLYCVRYLKTRHINAKLLSILLVIVGLSNYDYLPMTLSYNSWSLNFGLLFWSGLLFAHSTDSKRGIAFSNMLMGISVLFLFYTKAPNAIVMGLVFIIYTLIYQRKNLLNAILLFALGKIAGIIILFLSYEGFKTTTANLFHTILNTQHTNPGTYFRQFSDLVTNNLGIWFFLIQVLVIVAMYVIRKKEYSKTVGLLVILANSYLCIRSVKGNSFGIANEFVVFVLFAINCLATLVLFYSRTVKYFSFVSVSLILTPFLLAAGTSNPIFYTSSQLAVFCVAGLFLILLKIEQREIIYMYAYSALFLTLCMASFLYHGMILNPYRQTTLCNKTIPLAHTRQVNFIMEDKAHADKYLELAEKLKKNNPEKKAVLASPPVLGTLMLTEMDPFAVCWIADPQDNAIANDEYFKHFDLRNNKPFLFVARQLLDGKEQNEIFKKHGMDLKLDYVIKDSVYIEWSQEYCYLMQPIEHT